MAEVSVVPAGTVGGVLTSEARDLVVVDMATVMVGMTMDAAALPKNPRKSVYPNFTLISTINVMNTLLPLGGRWGPGLSCNLRYREVVSVSVRHHFGVVEASR